MRHTLSLMIAGSRMRQWRVQQDLQGQVWRLVRGLSAVGIGHASEKEQMYVNADVVVH